MVATRSALRCRVRKLRARPAAERAAARSAAPPDASGG